MRSVLPTGIYRFDQPPAASAEWVDYLRGVGFSAIMLRAATSPDVIAAWQALGLEVIGEERSDGRFAARLAHLFTAAQGDARHAEIFREFAGASEAGGTRLLDSWPLENAEDDPVAEFHRTAEVRTEEEKWDASLPGLAREWWTAETRARLLAAVGNPVDWRQHVLRWKEYAREVRAEISGTAPSAEAEYRFYQALLVAWPAAAPELSDASDLAARVLPDALAICGEDESLRAFAEGLFTSHAGRLFRKAFFPFAHALVDRAAALALAALVLQCTVPGVPEIRDGEELLDPRVPVIDRLRLLHDPATRASDPTAPWRDPRLKLRLLRTLLALRARIPALFASESYLRQKARGKFADSCFAFARQCPGYVLLVAVPRLIPPLATPPLGDAWEMTTLEICGITKIHWTNLFTGEETTGPYIALSTAFRELPVAVFLAASDDAGKLTRCP